MRSKVGKDNNKSWILRASAPVNFLIRVVPKSDINMKYTTKGPGALIRWGPKPKALVEGNTPLHYQIQRPIRFYSLAKKFQIPPITGHRMRKDSNLGMPTDKQHGPPSHEASALL